MFKTKNFIYEIKLANDKKIWCNTLEYSDMFIIVDLPEVSLKIPYTSILYIEERK
jgi:hypothetical protein